jgi:hypothetical protein
LDELLGSQPAASKEARTEERSCRLHLDLSRAQRRAIGQRLNQIEADLEALRREGVSGRRASEVGAAVARIRERTGAIAPTPPPGRRRAVAARVVVVAGDLAPRRLAGYGAVSGEAAGYLDEASRRLEALALRLVADVEAGPGPAT